MAVASCAPRFEPTTAWISSRMTRRKLGSRLRPPLEESMRFRLSGVDIRISGGRRSILRRSLCGVSPLRVITRGSCHGSSASWKTVLRSAIGDRRLRWMSLLRAFSGETYNTEVVSCGQTPLISWSKGHKKAASVLPVPVGAVTRRLWPATIWGHVSAWVAVGAP